MAFIVQTLLFGVFFFIDAKQTIAPDWQKVKSFGLHPLTVLFFGLSPLAMWWGYRVIYQAALQQYWTSSLWKGLIVQVVWIAASYLATRERPNAWQAVAVGLSLIASIVAGLK